jgi:hypothetical protein
MDFYSLLSYACANFLFRVAGKKSPGNMTKQTEIQLDEIKIVAMQPCKSPSE